jgi:hypothetical protein
VFGGRATVHPQGSASKGTALKGLSDWDFMVRVRARVCVWRVVCV